MKRAGYRTACVGKWHQGFKGLDWENPGNINELKDGPVEKGFDYFFGMHASLDIPPYFYIENDHAVQAPSLFVDDHASPDATSDVSTVDLFATILDYLAVDKQPSDGVSLRGLMEGRDTDHGEYVVTEWNYRGDIAPNYMVVKGGWKLMIPYSRESSVLNAIYDLSNDPHEMNNLLGSNPERELYEERAEELRSCLLKWLGKNNSKHYKGVEERDLI